jgi:triosephosphate isomerase (TIM)
MSPDKRRPFFGVSLKMYFGYAQTVDWCQRVSAMAAELPALADGHVELAVFPGFATLSAAVGTFAGSPVGVGAQDMFWEDRGPFTGEVGGPELREVGCRFVEIGHSERRRFFGETNETVARKLEAAARNELTVVLCIGEGVPGDPVAAAGLCVAQLSAVLGNDLQEERKVIVAYEPWWAIGAEVPASAEHIRTVCAAIRAWLDESPGLRGCRIIYGGSAGVGVLPELGDCLDGLFLGRFAHEPYNLARIISEATTRRPE